MCSLTAIRCCRIFNLEKSFSFVRASAFSLFFSPPLIDDDEKTTFSDRSFHLKYALNLNLLLLQKFLVLLRRNGSRVELEQLGTAFKKLLFHRYSAFIGLFMNLLLFRHCSAAAAAAAQKWRAVAAAALRSFDHFRRSSLIL